MLAGILAGSAPDAAAAPVAVPKDKVAVVYFSWSQTGNTRFAAETIAKLFREKHYLCDTHTAVAVNVYEQYLRETGDRTPCVIASTASPYKFAKAVLSAVAPQEASGDEFTMVEKLSEVTGTPIPGPLADLKNRAVLHKSCVRQAEMAEFIRSFLDQ